MSKISVIMPSYLEDYEGGATGRTQKFMRAVNSFLSQTHADKELIVIADGCEKTGSIVLRNFKKEINAGLIKLALREEHRGFVGAVRQSGIEVATGSILCNLDTDDTIERSHLANINATFNPKVYDWAFFNYYYKLDDLKGQTKLVVSNGELESLCTANVAWRPGLDVTWNGCDGVRDNKAFNAQLIEKYPHKIKIWGCGYNVHHAIITEIAS